MPTSDIANDIHPRSTSLRRRHARLWLAFVVALMCVMGFVRPLQAADASFLLKLPAFDGESSGDIKLFGENGLEFHWQMKVESPPDTPRLRRARLELSRPDTRAAVNATLDVQTGITHWEIESAEGELAELLPVLAPRFFPDFASIGASGKVRVSGSGDFTTDGKLSGKVIADITDAAIHDDARGWTAEGVSTRLVLPALPLLRTEGEAPLTVRKLTHTSTHVVLDDVRTSFSLDEIPREKKPGETQMCIHLGTLKANAFGGAIEVDALALNTDAPQVDTTVHVDDIESESLAGLLPGTIAEAHGRFSGAIALHWDAANGIVPGRGQLTLKKALGTSIRLTKTPGFFTSNMDKRLYVLPPSLGFLRNWISIKNPAYETLQQIENGEQPIAVESITINFTPEGDEKGRTATVAIAAHPTNPKSAIKNLRINVSVSGPVVKVLEMSTTDRLKISF